MPTAFNTLPVRIAILCAILLQTVVSGVLAALPSDARTRDFVVDLSAAVSETSPCIVLSWTLTQHLQSYISAQMIYRRLKGETVWVKLADLTKTSVSYADTTAVPGVEYEYWMRRDFTNIGSAPIGSAPSSSNAMGYISAGVKVPEVHSRGTLLLLVDDTMAAPLAPEIDQLKDDLAGDGWTVEQINAPRSGTPTSTKVLIKAAYDADPANTKALYILGHVPVPYSGDLYPPDGHTNVSGAWVADGYYGEMTSTWTDTTVNTNKSPETKNVPGDGRFDQSYWPSALELEVGRVDMWALTKAPSSAVTEAALLRRYLRRAHDFRYKQGEYANIRRRTLMLDSGALLSGIEPITINFWSTAFNSVPEPPAAPVIDEPTYGQWFASTGANSYLMGEAFGGGEYEGDSAVGTSTDFGSKANRVVFMAEMASNFGNWNGPNNLMRSIIAGNAAGTNLALTCFWVGRPNYFLHHMGMGETIGYSTRLSQNSNFSTYGNYYSPAGFFRGYVHQSLLGDPALRLHIVEPPRGLSATSAGGQVTLDWADSTEPRVQGYHVYRAATSAGPFTRLTPTPEVASTFTDATATAGQTYTYMVRTQKLEYAPGGSYNNLSNGVMATLGVSSGGTSAPGNPSNLTVTPGGVLAWTDNSGNETGFRIERKVNAGGTYATLATLAANVTGYTDPGPFTDGNVYYYRGIATGPGGDSIASNETSFDAVAGYFQITAPKLKVRKTAGTAQISVERFGGSAGAVTLSYSTTNASAIAGTHFTAPAGTLTWADGEIGEKNISVPITNTATPQQPRQFTISLTSATGGAGIGEYRKIAVVIEDPTATLPSPWSENVMGGVSDYSPAVQAEGMLGLASIGGSGFRWSTAFEEGHFISQSRTGDGVMTAFIPTPAPAQADAFFAVMIRDSARGEAPMAATVVSGSSNIGTQFIYRTSSWAGTVLTGMDTVQITPRWMRITRAGNTFTSESSADGVTWTTRGTAAITMGTTAVWGLFHISQIINSSTGYGDFQLAAFQNVSFDSLPATSAPVGLTVTSPTETSVNLTWTASPFAAGYRIERREESSGFTVLAEIASGATTTYTDNTVAAGGVYQYRIRASNSVGDSAWSSPGSVMTGQNLIVTASISAEADAMVRFASPTTPLGSGNVLTVAGSDTATDGLTPVAKSWLRFDLGGLPSLLSARIKLSIIASRDIDYTDPLYRYFDGMIYGLSEASDTWDEATIHWNNAPQNQTAGKEIVPPAVFLGELYLETPPAPGTLVSLDLAFAAINTAKGTNGKLTVAFVSYESSDASNVGAVDFASREHAIQPAPTLEVTYLAAAIKRPGFLTATRGAGSNMDLAWTDNSTDETGFQIERRTANGAWTQLQTLPANTTGFSDTTARPGIIYEYRVRSGSATVSSAWANSVSLQCAGSATVNAPAWSSDSLAFHLADDAPGSAYVPAGFIYAPPPLPFITGQTLSWLRNDFSGWVGMQISVGSNPITIRELGRWVVSGNAGAHTVKIVDGITGIDVPGGSVSIVTAGAPVGFKYAALASPITLMAGKVYNIVSQEVAGGDQWYEGNCVLTYATGVATIITSIWSPGGTGFNNSPFGANSCYVPVAFKYASPTVPFATGHAMSTIRNDYTGWLGMKLTVGPSDILASELGRMVLPGNSRTHTMKLVNAATGTTVASANVDTLGAPAGQFNYTTLASPVTLTANSAYYLLSQETAGGDDWYDYRSSAAGAPTGYQSWLLANGLPMDESGEGSASATPANDGLPNLIKYALGLSPGVSGNSGRLSYGQAAASGTDYLTLSYTRPDPAPTGITYTVEASTNLGALSWSSAGLTEVGNTLTADLRTITVRGNTPMSGGSKSFMRLKVTQP